MNADKGETYRGAPGTAAVFGRLERALAGAVEAALGVVLVDAPRLEPRDAATEAFVFAAGTAPADEAAAAIADTLRARDALLAAEGGVYVFCSESRRAALAAALDDVPGYVVMPSAGLEADTGDAACILMRRETSGEAVAELRARLAELRRRNDFLQESCARYSAEHEEASMRIIRMQRELSAFSELHTSVVESPAWKITWPLRYLGSQILKRLRRGEASGPAAAGQLDIGEWRFEQPGAEAYGLVSVIVPNYNHAPFLRARLDSIYNQTYQNIEVILLDDASSDDSADILREYAAQHADNTRLYVNEKNSGSAFAQWQKGLALARGPFVWIAESDDDCSLNFLKILLEEFRYRSVMLAFAKSLFVRGDSEVWTVEEYLHDLPGFDWAHPFKMTGHMAVQAGFAVRNIIPNVSSAVFRHPGELPQSLVDAVGEVRLVGDWMFYLHLLRGGALAYTNEAVNYHRFHEENTSSGIQQTQDYYREHEKLALFAAGLYRTEPAFWWHMRENLREHYALRHPGETPDVVDACFDVDRILERAKSRKPNIMQCTFSLQIGGGELVPIHLANEMKRQDLTVTLLDFWQQDHDEAVAGMVSPAVPMVAMSDAAHTRDVIKAFGADIVHSHHALVDVWVSGCHGHGDTPFKSVVSLHGMYEAMPRESAVSAAEQVLPTAARFFYLAEKNIAFFREMPGFLPDRFIRIDNGLPRYSFTPVPRQTLGIGDDDFVLCLASRALPEKGWAEAVEVVKRANQKSARPIHLLLLGDGPAADELAGKAPPFVHLMGVRGNVRDYIASSDLLFLPSRFKGESFPLVIIEALQTGRPVLASDIGEVKRQLTSEGGAMAGVVFELEEGQIPVDAVAEVVVKLAGDAGAYQKLVANVEACAARFDLGRIVPRYTAAYTAALGQDTE